MKREAVEPRSTIKWLEPVKPRNTIKLLETKLLKTYQAAGLFQTAKYFQVARTRISTNLSNPEIVSTC
jgi:hypothetical protein